MWLELSSTLTCGWNYNALVQLDYGRLTETLARTPGATAPDGCYSKSAVCLVLFDRPATTILAIVKADHTGDYSWGGHVALPGGHVTDSDPDAQATALRELEEEVAIAATDVTLLGDLGHFQTMDSGHDLQVLVCRWNQRFELQPDPHEVARVLELDLGRLVALHDRLTSRRPRSDEPAPPPRYGWDDVEIWGVTARILHDFIELVLRNDCTIA